MSREQAGNEDHIDPLGAAVSRPVTGDREPRRAPLVDLRREPLPWIVVLGVTLTAKAGALLPGYAIDDYAAAVGGVGPGLLGDVLGKGRWGHWLWLQIAVALQVEPNTARILYVGLAILAYSLFGIAVTRFWRLPRASWLTVAAACMIANHPYTAEIFTFRIGLPPAAIVMALLAWLLQLAGRFRPHLLLGCALFAAALSFYPIALHFACMVLLGGVLIDTSRWLVESRPGASQPIEPMETASHRSRASDLLGRPNLRLFLYITLGTLFYGVVGMLAAGALRLRQDYFDVLVPGQLPERILTSAKFVATTFAGKNVLIPRLVELAFGAVLSCVVVGMLWSAFRARRRLVALAMTAGAFALLALGFLWTVGVFLVLQSYWPVPRNMAHTGILWAACLGLAGIVLPRVKPVLAGAAAIILVSFVGVNQQIFEEQRRLNLRDLLEANRIVARLESIPGAEDVRRVAFVGGQAWYPQGLQRSQWGDMNISAFGATWSQVVLLREASGYGFVWATDPAEKEAGKSYCRTVKPWPSAASVAIRGDLAIVCMIQR